MHCCGVATYKDWKNASAFTKHGDTNNVPLACCRNYTIEPDCFKGVRKLDENVANRTIYTTVC